LCILEIKAKPKGTLRNPA